MGGVVAQLEKEGIPAVLESFDLPDLEFMAGEAFLAAGVPACRRVPTPPDTALTSLKEFIPDFIDALTKPLTDEEKWSGTYQSPIPPRIAMTGTYDEIQTYFEGDLTKFTFMAPHAWMTDGMPIVPPTEERVARMLMGTSHSPDEEIMFGKYIGNVEKVAINAVMAGAKPEYMPVILAAAELGPPTGAGVD